jgi:hypothetical protein
VSFSMLGRVDTARCDTLGFCDLFQVMIVHSEVGCDVLIGCGVL